MSVVWFTLFTATTQIFFDRVRTSSSMEKERECKVQEESEGGMESGSSSVSTEEYADKECYYREEARNWINQFGPNLFKIEACKHIAKQKQSSEGRGINQPFRPPRRSGRTNWGGNDRRDAE
jgi:hypothetical protein